MIGTLYRLNLRAVFASLLRRGRRARWPRFVFAGLFVTYVAGSVALAMLLLFSLLVVAFDAIGELWLYWALFAAISFSLGVLGSVFVAAGHLFGARDNEALLALPIRPGQILASRVLVLLTIECALSVPLFVPVAYVWLSAGHGTPVGVAMLLAGFVLLPVITLSVSLLLAWVLSAVVARVRRHRSLLTVVVALVFLLGYVAVFTAVQRHLGDLITSGAEVAAAVSRSMPPFHAFGVAVADEDPGRFALFVAWAVTPFVALVGILASRYSRILTAGRGTHRVAYHPRVPRRSGMTAALVGRELSQYWSRPMVVLNATIGSLMSLIGAGALVARRDVVLGYSNRLAGAVPGLTIPVLVTVAIALVGATNTLSASLVSLEGRTLWIARSLPVSSSRILRAKLLAHLAVSSGPCLLASIVTAWAAADDAAGWLLIVFVPQCFFLLTALGGLAVNLSLPRLDWLSEVQVVKQSASALVAVFGGIGVVVGFGIVYLVVGRLLVTPEIYLWFCGLACVLAALAVARHLHTRGVARFERLGS